MGSVSRAKAERDSAEVAVRLSVAMTRLRSRLRDEAGVTAAGFTSSQLAILDRLHGGPMTAAELAAVEHVTQQAIAQSVAILKEAGLVEKTRDASDARKSPVRITDAGRDMFERLRTSRKAWLVRAIDGTVEPAERPDLDKAIELLERLAGADLSQD
jgi:DNA-binding MarR family transcriptional regulator